MTRTPLVPLLAALAAWFAAAPALACKCMLPTVEAAREDASAIFEGLVVAIAESGDSPATNGELKVTLDVTRAWKGMPRAEQVVVTTNGSTAACGYPFRQGVSYLVYTRDHEGHPTVSHCSRTKPISEADEDLAALGLGSTPVKVDAADAGTSQGKASRPEPVGATKPVDGAGTPASAPPAAKKGGCGGGSAAFAPVLFAPALFRRKRRAARERLSP